MLSGMELKIKRIMLGIQAKEIAQLLGVSKPFVTYMENEQKKIPNEKYEMWINFLELKENN
jgi:transcriptional regulator with XRE-family HTH domain